MTLLGVRRPRNPLRPTKFSLGQSKTLPAPTGGLNLRDDISNLKPNEARVLENWLPTTGQMSMRPGKTHHAVGMVGEVKTLAAYEGYSAAKMIAAANGSIFDVTDGTDESPNDSYTKIFLALNGADASTTITDTAEGATDTHTWTAVGNAQLDTASSHLGGSSALFDGVGDYLTTTYHSDYYLSDHDFTLDFWFNCTSPSGAAKYICGQSNAAVTTATSSVIVQRTAGDIILASVVVGGSSIYQVTGTTQYTDVTNTGWHHFALVRTDGTLKMFVDGVQEGSNVAITGQVTNAAGQNFSFGTCGTNTAGPWIGWLDEIRLSVGIARWTAAFTPPVYSPTVLATGFAADQWQHALYGDRLFFVNGSDTPQVYNGSTCANIAWSGSGLTNTNLINVALVRNRLWFCEKDQAWVWYGNVGQITAASALTKFDLHQIAGGGYCMAAASWSRDGGDGADDLTVFVMSTGEIITYQGDPATTFSLVGKFRGAPPIGRQCCFQVGGELVIITTQGLLPVSTATGGTVTAQDIAAIDPWGKIAPGLAVDASADRGNPGWHGVFHLGLVYINVPQTSGEISKQWVLNTRTGSWTSYTSLNMAAMCPFNGELYFGTMDGGVKSHAGGSDDGTDITAVSSGAFVYPSKTQVSNLFTAARPKIKAEGTVTGFVGVDVDFNQKLMTGATYDFSTGTAGGAWDTSEWDVTAWAADSESVQRWYSIEGMGRAVAVRMIVTASSTDVQWYATDLLYKPGGIK